MADSPSPGGPGAGSASGFRKGAESPVWSGHVIQVATGRFESPEGESFEREIVHHPGAVVVVPLLDAGRALMVRQYRAALDQDLLELPAGKRDVAGEPTEETARRELVEEVGQKAHSFTLLACFYNSPGFSDEFSWLYLAEGLSAVGNDLQGVEERHMSVCEVRLADVPGLIASGGLVDAKSIIGLTLAREALSARH